MKRKDDPSQRALKQVEKLTQSGPVRGEDLLGSPKLKRQLQEAKKRIAGKRKR